MQIHPHLNLIKIDERRSGVIIPGMAMGKRGSDDNLFVTYKQMRMSLGHPCTPEVIY